MTQDLINQIELYRKQYDYDTVAFSIVYVFQDSHDYDMEISVSPHSFSKEWSKLKKSQFIESILIGIPLKPMYAINRRDERLQRECTTLEVIDRQRFVTLEQFFFNNLKLEGLEQLDELNGCYLKDIPVRVRSKFKKATQRIVIFNNLGEKDIEYLKKEYDCIELKKENESLKKKLENVNYEHTKLKKQYTFLKEKIKSDSTEKTS